ncbi:MAG: serine proteinase [Oscillospiraceae bacterium]|nr:serine proteinase [Oscillospiraceae bacterium]
MAFFDFETIKDKAKDLAQTGVNKSKQLGEIAKLNLANVGEEDAIKKAYIEIGKLYYAERGMAPEAAYTALCEKITAAKVNIEENKNRIEEIKAEGNIVDADVEPAFTVEETPKAEVETPEILPQAPVEPLADDTKQD